MSFYGIGWLTSPRTRAAIKASGVWCDRVPRTKVRIREVIAEHTDLFLDHLWGFVPTPDSMTRLAAGVPEVSEWLGDDGSTQTWRARDPFPLGGKHLPLIVLLNASTGQGFGIGLGRKGQFFSQRFPTAAGGPLVLDDSGAPYDDVRIETGPGSFMRRFLEHDHAGVVTQLVSALYIYGIYSRELHLEHPASGCVAVLEAALRSSRSEGPVLSGWEGLTRADAEAHIIAMKDLQAEMSHERATLLAVLPELAGRSIDPEDY